MQTGMAVGRAIGQWINRRHLVIAVIVDDVAEDPAKLSALVVFESRHWLQMQTISAAGANWDAPTLSSASTPV